MKTTSGSFSLTPPENQASAGHPPVSSEYGETQVSARRTGVTSLNIQGTGADLGHRAGIASFWNRPDGRR
jgi:hypothetical protein